MTRADARTFLMEILFQMELNKDFNKENIPSYLKVKNYGGQEKYLNQCLEYVCDNKDAIDSLLDKTSHKWKTTRMAKIDLTLLRLANAEFNIEEDIPQAVTINECVKLAKKYSGEDAPKFVNGILGKIVNG